MKHKVVLHISVIYEDFSLTPEQIREIVSKNISSAINRGRLTEGLDSLVSDWSLTFDFKPEGLTMPSQIYLKMIYEGNKDESESIKDTLYLFADTLASRGYLSDSLVPIKEWHSQVVVQKI